MNPFELLAIEEDGAPIKQQTPVKKTTQSPTKKAEPTTKASAPAKGRMETDRKGTKPTAATRSQTNISQGASQEDAALPDRPDRGASMRGGRKPAPPANRNFDRHSRSGRRQEGEKRQFSGKGNWGNPADAGEAVVAEATTASTEEVAVAGEEVEMVAVEKEVASPFMTLDQYLAEQEKKKPAVTVPSTRAANDGAKVDGEVVKKTDDMYFQIASKTEATKTTAAPKKQEKPTATKLTLQELNAVIPGGINRPPRPAREESFAPRKDGRNAGRRGGNVNSTGGRSNNFRSEAPRNVKTVNIKDATAFPAL